MILFKLITPTYGAYGETLGRKIQYESEVQEDGAKNLSTIKNMMLYVQAFQPMT